MGNPHCPPNICTSAHVQASLPMISHPKHFGVTQFVGIHQGKFKMTDGRIKGSKIRGSVQDGQFVPNSQQNIQTQKQVKFIYFQDWSHTRKILILSMSLIWMLRLILMSSNFLDKAHFSPLAVLIFAFPLLKSAFLAKLSKGYSACTWGVFVFLI